MGCCGGAGGELDARGLSGGTGRRVGMRSVDEEAVVRPAGREENHWYGEGQQEMHRLEVDVALIDRFNPEGRGAALLDAM